MYPFEINNYDEIEIVNNKVEFDNLFNSSIITEREKYILYKLYYEERTFEEIGNDQNLSKQRISEIHENAIKKIKNSSYSKKLK